MKHYKIYDLTIGIDYIENIDANNGRKALEYFILKHAMVMPEKQFKTTTNDTCFVTSKYGQEFMAKEYI